MIEGLLKRAKCEERTMRSITGMSILQFTELTIFFEHMLCYSANKKQRVRGIGGRHKGILRKSEQKVFFILFYLKVSPTYDLAAMFFQADRSQPCRWVKVFFPILEKALGRKRKISLREEF